MKVIFLDFDGVINNWYDFDGVSLNNAKILKEIITQTDAKIVVTSSNKYSLQRSDNPSYFASNFYRKYIKPLNELGIEIYDMTPCIEYNRTLEIQNYLYAHEVEEYVIIDDDLIGEKLQEHQVFLNLYKGLQLEHIKPVLKILDGQLGFYPSNFNLKETPDEKLLRISKYYNSIKKNKWTENDSLHSKLKYFLIICFSDIMSR